MIKITSNIMIFLQELNSKPIFEQVIPSRSSKKKGKNLGADLPPLHPLQVLKGPKSVRFYRVSDTDDDVDYVDKGSNNERYACVG